MDKLCELCEKTILGCKHSTPTFLCEGRFWQEAYELLLKYDDSFRIQMKRDEALKDLLE